MVAIETQPEMILRMEVVGGGYFAARREGVEEAIVNFILRTGERPTLNGIMACQARVLAEMFPAGLA
jgi:hypothetical protein